MSAAHDNCPGCAECLPFTPGPSFEVMRHLARLLAKELASYHEMPDHSARNCGPDCETKVLLARAAGLLEGPEE
jgi:hypothetical protein